MSDVSAPPDVMASRPVLMAMGCLGTLVAMILVAGGIYLATAERMAKTTFELFGNQFASTSVGVSMAFMGAVVVIVVFRSILKALEIAIRK